MNLQDIKGPYDSVISLGSWCLVAIQLRVHKLRTFSSPFDWVLSYSLSDVNRLLKNRFDGYMELKNMELHGNSTPAMDDQENWTNQKTYMVKDTCYNIISVHDFPIIDNEEWFESYPAFKEKLNIRINRFIEKITQSQSILFIRHGGNYHDTIELKSILSQFTNSNFNILIVNPIDGIQGIVEKDWKIDGVCSIEVEKFKQENNWRNSNWDYILSGISVKESKFT